jgi:hypothetical protein
MKRKQPGPRRLKVASPRNSALGTGLPLSDIDWSRGWWTSYGFSGQTMHLYVWTTGKSEGEPTVQRLYCRRSHRPRLEMRDGELYWLVD